MIVKYILFSAFAHLIVLSLFSKALVPKSFYKPYRIDLSIEVMNLDELPPEVIKDFAISCDESYAVRSGLFRGEEIFWKVEPSFTYPREAEELGEEGEVVLLLDVLPNGVIDRVLLEKKSGSSILDESAIRDIQKGVLGFKYTSESGVRVRVTIPYRLR